MHVIALINIATLFSKGQNALIKTVIIYMSLRKILDDANSTDEELNDAYDRINGIEGYSVSARASAIFSGLGFKDDRLEHH